MVVERALVLCCVACVVCGHAITKLDLEYVTNEIQQDTEEAKVTQEALTHVASDINVDRRLGNGREGSKDMLYPILFGVAAKIVSTIPLFLTSLALVAGYSLATSKAALLLGAIFMVYHYISNYNILTPVDKHRKHLVPDWGASMLAHHGYLPQYHGFPGLGYHRDRNDRRPDLLLTD